MDPPMKNTDWPKCFICQTITEAPLRTPKEGYQTLSTNLPKFHDLRSLPAGLNLQRIDNGNGIEKTLKENSAKYHNKCQLLFKNTRLEQLKRNFAVVLKKRPVNEPKENILK